MRLHGLLSLLEGSGARYVVLRCGRKALSAASGLADVTLYSTVAAVVSGGLLVGGIGSGSLFMLGFYEIASTRCARAAIIDLVVGANHHVYFTCGYEPGSVEPVTTKRLGSKPKRLTSLARIWRSASWQERDVADMLGVEFVGAGDRRSLFLPALIGLTPLRRGSPTAGFVELGLHCSGGLTLRRVQSAA
jgi:hypothetical protein